MFASKQKYKDKQNDLMQNLVSIVLNSLYGVQIRKDINDFNKCKSKYWMQTEYEDNVLDYWQIQKGNYTVKLKKDDGLDDDNEVQNTLLSHLGAFILKNSRRFRIKFIRDPRILQQRYILWRYV